MVTLFPGLRAAKAINLVLKKVVATSDMHTSCDIHLNGTRLGSFVDHGDGGHANFVVINKHRDLLFAALRQGSLPCLPSLPAEGIIFDPATMNDHEYAASVFFNLIGETQSLKSIKRKAKTNTLVVFTDYSPGEYATYKIPFNEESKKAVIAKFGDRISFFVNEDILSA